MKIAIHVQGHSRGPGRVAAKKLALHLGAKLSECSITYHPSYEKVFRSLRKGDCFVIVPVEPYSPKRKINGTKISRLTRKEKSTNLFVAHEFRCNSVIKETTFKAVFKTTH